MWFPANCRWKLQLELYVFFFSAYALGISDLLALEDSFGSMINVFQGYCDRDCKAYISAYYLAAC